MPALVSDYTSVIGHSKNFGFPLCLFLILLALFGVPSLNARIGETLEECEVRYGPPVKGPIIDSSIEGAQQYAFAKSGFEVGVTFHQGKAVVLLFSKLEKDALGNSVAMSKAEIEVFLEANQLGGPWVELPSTQTPFMHKGWFSPDADTAVYNQTKNYLVIMSKAYLSLANEAKEQKERQNLEDF